MIGHVEHVTLGTVDAFPIVGDIVHFRSTRVFPGGGGGVAFAQLLESDAEVHLFTAAGADEAGQWIASELRKTRAHVHCASRQTAHPRVMVLIDGEGHRTIFVPEPPLQPAATDPLPWELLATFDAVYFTGADPGTASHARKAHCFVATARRGHVLAAAGVMADVLVGSRSDPRENAAFETYALPPKALVLTDGPRPIRVYCTSGATTVDSPGAVLPVVGDYGAGDSFAAALTYFVSRGVEVEEAARRAGPYGAAVLRHTCPLGGQASLTLEAPKG